MKRVSCFGHREIFSNIESASEITELNEHLSVVIEQQILYHDSQIFLMGRRGEFNNVFANVVRKLKVKYPYIKLILVEPYFSNALNNYREYYESIYDSIIIPKSLANVPRENAITLRNQWMIENCDLVISYVDHKSGSAYNAIKYAENLNKFVINIGNI